MSKGIKLPTTDASYGKKFSRSQKMESRIRGQRRNSGGGDDDCSVNSGHSGSHNRQQQHQEEEYSPNKEVFGGTMVPSRSARMLTKARSIKNFNNNLANINKNKNSPPPPPPAPQVQEQPPPPPPSQVHYVVAAPQQPQYIQPTFANESQAKMFEEFQEQELAQLRELRALQKQKEEEERLIREEQASLRMRELRLVREKRQADERAEEDARLKRLQEEEDRRQREKERERLEAKRLEDERIAREEEKRIQEIMLKKKKAAKKKKLQDEIDSLLDEEDLHDALQEQKKLILSDTLDEASMNLAVERLENLERYLQCKQQGIALSPVSKPQGSYFYQAGNDNGSSPPIMMRAPPTQAKGTDIRSMSDETLSLEIEATRNALVDFDTKTEAELMELYQVLTDLEAEQTRRKKDKHREARQQQELDHHREMQFRMQEEKNRAIVQQKLLEEQARAEQEHRALQERQRALQERERLKAEQIQEAKIQQALLRDAEARQKEAQEREAQQRQQKEREAREAQELRQRLILEEQRAEEQRRRTEEEQERQEKLRLLEEQKQRDLQLYREKEELVSKLQLKLEAEEKLRTKNEEYQRAKEEQLKQERDIAERQRLVERRQRLLEEKRRVEEQKNRTEKSRLMREQKIKDAQLLKQKEMTIAKLQQKIDYEEKFQASKQKRPSFNTRPTALKKSVSFNRNVEVGVFENRNQYEFDDDEQSVVSAAEDLYKNLRKGLKPVARQTRNFTPPQSQVVPQKSGGLSARIPSFSQIASDQDPEGDRDSGELKSALFNYSSSYEGKRSINKQSSFEGYDNPMSRSDGQDFFDDLGLEEVDEPCEVAVTVAGAAGSGSKGAANGNRAAAMKNGNVNTTKSRLKVC